MDGRFAFQSAVQVATERSFVRSIVGQGDEFVDVRERGVRVGLGVRRGLLHGGHVLLRGAQSLKLGPESGSEPVKSGVDGHDVFRENRRMDRRRWMDGCIYIYIYIS